MPFNKHEYFSIVFLHLKTFTDRKIQFEFKMSSDVKIPASGWKSMEISTVNTIQFNQNNENAGWKMCKSPHIRIMQHLLYQNQSSAKR